jgi:drug/metabolite transporter (DMT)-like permease
VSAAGRGPVAAAIAILFVFLWASAYVPSKIASVESPPLWFLTARFGAAGLILAALAVALRRRAPATVRGWLVACALGVLTNALYLGLTYTALQHLSSGMGAIVASTNPLVLALLAPRLLGERLTRLKGAGLVLGFGGVLAIVLARAGSGGARPADVLLAFCGVLAGVGSTLLFKRWAEGADLIVVNAIQLLAAAVVVAPVAFLVYGAPHVTPTRELTASFAYLVLVVSVGASLLWFWLLSRGEASRVSAYYYLTPAFGLALSALLLHERIEAHDIAGLVAIAGGIALVQRA